MSKIKNFTKIVEHKVINSIQIKRFKILFMDYKIHHFEIENVRKLSF
jgi:hypothetical protein